MGRVISLQLSISTGSTARAIKFAETPRTDHKTGEKGIDPTHDQGLRNHHHHVSLEHPHHGFHARWIRHWVRWRLATVVGVFQECASPESIDQIVPASLKRLAV